MMLRALGAILLMSITAAQAARIDDGPLPDIGRLIQGCWINDEGTLADEIAAAAATQLELCFADGVVDTALIDSAGTRVATPGAYSFRNEKIILTSDAAWVFGRATLICDIGVKPYVRLALFDCVGSGHGEPTEFFDDLLFLAKKEAVT
jgi:hypothetical protein